MSHSGIILPEPLIPDPHIIPLTDDQKQQVFKNRGLAHKITNDYYYSNHHGTLTKDEILSAAFWGLMYAVQHYIQAIDDLNNDHWSSYALKCMKGFIYNEINNQKLIHIPKYLKQKHYPKKGWKGGRYKTNRVVNKKNAERTVGPYPFNLTEKEKEEKEVNKLKISDYFYLLTPKQKQIILLYLRGLTFREIGEILGKTRSNCNIVFHNAIKRIKNGAHYRSN